MFYVLLYYSVDYMPITEFFYSFEDAMKKKSELLPKTHYVIYEIKTDNEHIYYNMVERDNI